MNLIFRGALYLAAFVVPILLTGALGVITSVRTAMPRPEGDFAAGLAPQAYDPSKPTLAVALGAEAHEMVDTIDPYALFAESGLYAVARATLVMLRLASLGLSPLSLVEGLQIRPIRAGEEGRVLHALNHAWAGTWNFRPLTRRALERDLAGQREGFRLELWEARLGAQTPDGVTRPSLATTS